MLKLITTLSVLLSLTCSATEKVYQEHTTNFPNQITHLKPTSDSSRVVIKCSNTARLYIYSLKDRKVVHIIQTPTDNFQYAVGGGNIVVYTGSKKLFQVYRSNDYKRVSSFISPTK